MSELDTEQQEQVVPLELEKKANAMLDKAKLQLISIKKSTFTTTLLFSLKFKWSLDIQTADVNGVDLRINPKFFETLQPPERVFLLAHEAWHVAFEHITRFEEMGEKADFKTYNEAADHVINLMLREKGYAVPQNACCNPKYTNWSTEQVYHDLMKNKSQNPNFIPDFTPSSNNQGNNQKTKSGMTPDQMKNKIDEMLVKANTASQMEAGQDGAEDVPDCIAERIEELVNPKVDWRTLLRNFMFEIRRDDYSYRRPNRKYMPHVILPSLYSEGMGALQVAIDVSGSVSNEQFNAFKTEINEIKDTLNPSSTEIVQWHHKISSIDVLDEYQDMSSVEFKETGGTNVYPVLERAIENPPQVMVIFTDGYFTPFDKPEQINFPVIWVIYDNNNFSCEFGQVVEYEPDLN